MQTGEGKVDMEGEDTKQRSTIIPRHQVFVPWLKCHLIHICHIAVQQYLSLSIYIYINYFWDVRDSFFSGV